MKQAFISETDGNSRLVLIFAGWGMDDRPFRSLEVAGYDVMVVWDYRSLQIDMSAFDGYEEVYLFAWSFGVFAASMVMKSLETLPLMVRIAVNGSMAPVDDERGIPEAIFAGTLSGLNERNLMKFYRRMCGISEEYKVFCGCLPDRDIDGLKEELEAIRSFSRTPLPDGVLWDRAVIADGDRIFPVENLDRAWAGLQPRVRHVAGGHLPDFRKIIEQEIIDKTLVSRRFNDCHSTYMTEAVVQRDMAERLWSLVRPHIGQSPRKLLEIGYGTGMLTEIYRSELPDADVTLWDLAPQPVDFEAEIVAGDAERMICDLPDSSVDLILSASTVQWFNNLPRFILMALSKLAENGMMAFSTFGPGNFKEVTALTRLPLRYYSLDELSNMIPHGFVITNVAEELREMEFETPRQVMAHLGHTGVNALRGVDVSYQDFAARFPKADGRYRLTYHPQYIVIKRSKT